MTLRMLMLRKIGQTVLFYGVLFLAMSIGHWIYPGGPCVPGIGMLLAFVVFFPLCIFLFAWNFYKYIKQGTAYLPSMIIHGLVVSTLFFGVVLG